MMMVSDDEINGARLSEPHIKLMGMNCVNAIYILYMVRWSLAQCWSFRIILLYAVLIQQLAKFTLVSLVRVTMSAEQSVNQQELRFQRRRERDRAHHQSESAQQWEERL